MRTSHQGVILTPWWSRWLTRDGDGENDAPTSQYDSLVVLMVSGGGDGENDAPTSHIDSLVVLVVSEVEQRGKNLHVYVFVSRNG